MKRYFGQNFLKNKSIINSIVDAIGIERNDFVLEIGPGRGALTDVINFNFGDQINFTIVEKDTDLIPFLLEKYSDCLLYTSPSPRDATLSRMPSSA